MSHEEVPSGPKYDSPLMKLLSSQEKSKWRYIPDSYKQVVLNAFHKGHHLVGPPRTSEDRWIRNVNIAASFLMSGADYPELAEVYRTTVGNITHIVKRTLLHICDQFPIKYPPSQQPSEYRFLVRKGVGDRLIEALGAGQTPEQIQQSLSLSRFVLNQRLHFLENAGMKIPIFRPNFEERRAVLVAILRDEELPDIRVQAALNKVGSPKLYYYLASEDPPVLVLLSKAFEDAGVHIRGKRVHALVESIKRSKSPPFPVGRAVRPGKKPSCYHFIAAWQQPRVERFAQEDYQTLSL